MRCNMDYHTRCAFRLDRSDIEQSRAELTCFTNIARQLVALNHNRYTVTYTISVVPHEFDERLHYVQIDAIIVVNEAG